MNGAANQFLKRLLPLPVQRLIYRFLWNPVRDAYWGRLKLDCELASGLRVEVRNRSDWTIYNEIFVNGEYDSAIDLALEQRDPARPFVVADFGGNVGYFTFRCADRFFRRCGNDAPLQFVLVEGSPSVSDEVKRRVADQPLLRDRVKVRHGLVGQRGGAAYIGGSHIHYGNTTSAEPAPGAIRVPFLDLDEEFAGVEEIDLVKCDVEGAEFDFIANYRTLLQKTRSIAFEFHRYGRSIDEARATLKAYGFRNHKVLRDTPTFLIELYWR